MSTAQRLKGQEVSILIVRDGNLEDTLVDIQNFNLELEFEIKTQGYLGEKTNRRDMIFNGAKFDMELNLHTEDYLSFLLAMKNKAALANCEFQEIVTTDPHTYNTLKNEYASNGSADGSPTVPVFHYTEVLDRAIASGELPIRRQLGYTVTYHDPCYLGRYNGVYDAPRRVLDAIGCRLVEMPRNRDRSLCCGAGGGRIWMDEAGVKERPSENRIREAAALDNVQYFVVACPKDVTMYRDAVKTAGQESKIEVKDMIELVEEALG